VISSILAAPPLTCYIGGLRVKLAGSYLLLPRVRFSGRSLLNRERASLLPAG
jgi:hypothetical protein